MTAVLAIALGLLPLPALFAPRGRWAGWLVAAVAVAWLGAAIATYLMLPPVQNGAIGMAPRDYQSALYGRYVISLALIFLAAGAIYLGLSRLRALVRPGLSALCVYAAHVFVLVPLYISAKMTGMTFPRQYADYNALSDRANELAVTALMFALIAAGGFVALGVFGIIQRLRVDDPQDPPDPQA